MTTPLKAFFILLIFPFLLPIPADASQESDIPSVISMLDEQIEATVGKDDRARLCCFRARNYHKIGDMENAEQDYLEALDYSYKGWILNEYGYFLFKNGEYERAYKAASKLIEDFPYMEKEGSKLLGMAKEKYEEEYYAANPPTIIMDDEVNHDRVTRHDLIRKYGSKKEALIFSNVTVSKPAPKSASTSSRSSGSSKKVRRS